MTGSKVGSRQKSLYRLKGRQYSYDYKTCATRARATWPNLSVGCIISKGKSGMFTISEFMFYEVAEQQREINCKSKELMKIVENH